MTQARPWPPAGPGVAPPRLAARPVILPARPATVPAGPAARPARPAAPPRAGFRDASWTVAQRPPRALRPTQLALGVFWLVDAGLQYQPFMFSRAFVTGVIEPAATGSPGFVARPLTLASQLMLHDPVAFNALFATVQLLIGLGLCWRPAVRAALAVSIVWALSIWWLGEGLGGLLAGAPSPVTGAPGAALLYVLLAVLAWPRPPGAGRGRVGASLAAASPLRRPGAALAWLALWGSGAGLLLLPANRAPGALSGQLAAAAGEPGWLASLQHGAAAAAGLHGAALSAGLAAVFAAITVGLLVPGLTRPALVLAMITAAVIWVLGEGLGGMLTGQGTDPNTGPLLILVALAYWPAARPGRRAARPRPAAARGRHRGGRARRGRR